MNNLRDKEYYKRKIERIKNDELFANNTDVAYALLLNDIANGVIKMGNRIPQEAIAELYGMSRTPVRDAMNKLSDEGIVVKNTSGGYNVCTIDLKEYMDFHIFRELIETTATFYAARNMSVREKKKLKDNVIKTQIACEKNTFKDLYILEIAFHEMIVTASQNRYLIQSFQEYKKKRDFYNRLVLNQISVIPLCNKHKKIYEAIEECDEEKAKKMMQSHLSFYADLRNLAILMRKSD